MIYVLTFLHTNDHLQDWSENFIDVLSARKRAERESPRPLKWYKVGLTNFRSQEVDGVIYNIEKTTVQ